MKFILIMILQYYDAGGITVAEFDNLQACEAAKSWTQTQIINKAVKNKHYSAVRSECFPASKEV